MSEIICSDCLKEMLNLEPESVDSVVTDPPYALAFMGKDWDSLKPKEYQEFSQEWGKQALRVLRSGAYLLAFSGTRTYHRMVVGLEDAGFVIKDQIDWLYGSGFPKSKDISKSIDKRAGSGEIDREKLGNFIKKHRKKKDLSRKEASKRVQGKETGSFWNWENGYSVPSPENWSKIKEILNLPDSNFDKKFKDLREKIGKGYRKKDPHPTEWGKGEKTFDKKVSTSEKAKKWNGWGTALKPAHEPIVLAQKPREGTYAENVLEHGVGGLNIDGCRIKTKGEKPRGSGNEAEGTNAYGDFGGLEGESITPDEGRWPANVILNPQSSAMLDEQSGERISASQKYGSENGETAYFGSGGKGDYQGNGDYSGGASRFFYCAKAHKSERNAGLEDLEDVKMGQSGGARQKLKEGKDEYQTGDDVSVGLNKIKEVKNDIATLKPINLMRYLVRLVTPPDGTVLDPFAGSGTTGCACEIEGFDYILIEKRERFAEVIAPRRTEYWSKEENWDDLKEHKELEAPTERKNANLEEFV